MLCEETIYGQRSWVMESNSVRMAITQIGTHLAPVTFYRDEEVPVQPYHISPWQEEACEFSKDASEAILRGDFFCLPFGHAEPNLGVCSHGRTAGMPWSFVGTESRAGLHGLWVLMENALHSATVMRQFFLRDGENVVYDRTSITGLEGVFTLGHHAVLRTPQQSKTLLISTSKQILGMTFPGPFAITASGERQLLAIAAEFDTLAGVPSICGNMTTVDCSAYPIRNGFSDLLQIAVEAEHGQPAWTVAVNTQEEYLWFSLRDPALLPSTIIWIENCGRRNPPWNGRTSSLGLEDVCSYFDRGSEVARLPNIFSQRGIKTAQEFLPDETFHLSYIQGVLRLPRDFGRVRNMQCDSGGALFTDVNGITVRADVETGFVFGEQLSNRPG